MALTVSEDEAVESQPGISGLLHVCPLLDEELVDGREAEYGSGKANTAETSESAVIEYRIVSNTSQSSTKMSVCDVRTRHK